MEPTVNEAAGVVTVQDIMTREVTTSSPEQPIAEAITLLSNQAISGMPVLDGTGELIGMVSEYDIISKRGKTVGDIMTRGVISVPDDADAEQVAEIISMHGVRQVPVVKGGQLAGIVSRADLVRLCASVRWTCDDCDMVERGFLRLERCPECGGTNIHLDRDQAVDA
jgi:CBS-domain-containing membrane protein